MKTIQFSWAVIYGLGLALLILSKTLERLLYGLAQERLVEDNTIFLGCDFWAGLGLVNIKQNIGEALIWTGPREALMLTRLGLGLNNNKQTNSWTLK